MLFLTLLGDYSARVGSRAAGAFTFRTQKAVALFAYVALQRRRVPRDELARVLWAEVPEDQARHSLRQALFEIRSSVGPAHRDILHADRWFLYVDRARVRVDVHTFERLVARRNPHRLRHACDLYGGDLLAGLHTREPFDIWLAAERRRLKQLAIDAHEQYLKFAAEAGLFDEATRAAQALIGLTPLNEWAHRMLATLFARTGDVRKASHHLQTVVEMLMDLGHMPEPDTYRLIDEIHRHHANGVAPVLRLPPQGRSNDRG